MTEKANTEKPTMSIAETVSTVSAVLMLLNNMALDFVFLLLETAR